MTHVSELQQLRDRVEELEEALGIAAGQLDQFGCLGLAPLPTSLMGMLYKSNIVSREAAFVALYGSRIECDQPDIKNLDVYIWRVRDRLKRYGITVNSQRGVGWYMTQENKAKLRAYLEGPQ